jgi:pimeloyl-ACP methyl ester carboxylesterase
LQDCGGPVGLCMALSHPDRVEAIIVQNAVAHEDGLSKPWVPRRAFFENRNAHEAALRMNFLSLDATRAYHTEFPDRKDRFEATRLKERTKL